MYGIERINVELFPIYFAKLEDFGAKALAFDLLIFEGSFSVFAVFRSSREYQAFDEVFGTACGEEGVNVFFRDREIGPVAFALNGAEFLAVFELSYDVDACVWFALVAWPIVPEPDAIEAAFI